MCAIVVFVWVKSASVVFVRVKTSLQSNFFCRKVFIIRKKFYSTCTIYNRIRFYYFCIYIDFILVLHYFTFSFFLAHVLYVNGSRISSLL